MKKMSIVTALIMLVTITTYSVSGTYAKYTSQIDLTDEARVASWGFSTVDRTNCTPVETTEGTRWECKQEATNLNLFASSYTYNEDAKVYVRSLDGDKVVAPGTAGEYKIGFKGAMEVRHDFKIDFGVEDAKEVAVTFDVNADGSLTIYDKGSATQGQYTYSPITYTVNLFNGNTTLVNKEGKLSEIQAAFAKWNESVDNDFAPGRLGIALDLGWKWDKENAGYEYAAGKTLTLEQADKLDTYIGEHWAEWYPDVDGKGGQNDLGNESIYKLSVSATQIAENHSKKAN